MVNIDVSHLNGSNESQDDDSAELVRQLEAGSNKDLKVVHLTLIVIFKLQEGDSDLNRNTAKLCSIFESFNM